jgi:NDP-sugar pyrophosphorylase family protein
MKAMILAAGLGTRLRPLTDSRPKALVEIAGRTLLEITLTRLHSFGVNEVIINVHHFAGMVVDYLKSKNNFGMRIEISREDDLLLDTGGGLKKAAWFFLENSGANISANLDEPFVLHNVDVISNIDFTRMLQFHKEHRALATLAVKSRASSRRLLFNGQLELRGRRISGHDTLVSTSGATGTVASGEWRVASEKKKQIPRSARNDKLLPHALAFSGIHVISPRLLPMLTENGVFSIIDAYLRLASLGEKILAFRADEYYWRDLGRPSDLSQAAADLENGLLAESGHSL